MLFINERDKESTTLWLDCDRSIAATYGGKTIPDSAEPRLESFNTPWVTGIDPYQGVVDSYTVYCATVPR